MLSRISFSEAHSLALANIYAGLSGVLDHQIPENWSFTTLTATEPQNHMFAVYNVSNEHVNKFFR
jgi:hypothetical protein